MRNPTLMQSRSLCFLLLLSKLYERICAKNGPATWKYVSTAIMLILLISLPSQDAIPLPLLLFTRVSLPL